MKTTRNALCRMDSAWVKTDEGYLDAKVFPTRPGVFKYLNKDGTVRRELRPRSEVHDVESMASLENKPHTNSHPPKLLNSRNTRKYQTGSVYGEHKVSLDGLHTECRVLVTDEDNIRDIEGGKVQVSCGYTCDYDETPGEDPEFGPYDGIQKNIRYNHLASEWRGRAGSGARLTTDGSDEFRFDAWEIDDEEENPNKNKELSRMNKIRIDGKEYEVSEAAEVALGHKFDADAKALDAAQAEADKERARADKAEAERDAAQAKVSELEGINIDQMVQARVDLLTTASKFVKDAKFDGLSDREVKELVIESRMDWASTEGKSDEYVNGLFESAIKQSNKNTVMDAYDSAQPPKGQDDKVKERVDALASARESMHSRMNNGWKKLVKGNK